MKRHKLFFYEVEVPYMYFDENGNAIYEPPKKNTKFSGWKSNYFRFFSSHKMKHFLKDDILCIVVKAKKHSYKNGHYYFTEKYLKTFV